jgi:hypothetical protein
MVRNRCIAHDPYPSASVNVVLSCGAENRVDSRRLPGGAEGIRTSDLRGAGGRSPAGGAAPGSARLNSEGAPPSALVSPTLCLPPVRPSDLPRRPRRGDDGRPLLDSEASVAKAIERALDKPWLELDLGVSWKR